MRVVKHWNKLSRKAVGPPSLESFNTGVDKVLSKLVHLLTLSCLEQEVGLDGLQKSLPP